MAVTVEIHNTGDAGLQRDVVAMVEHVLADRRPFCAIPFSCLVARLFA
jgi:hypothetical protein